MYLYSSWFYLVLIVILTGVVCGKIERAQDVPIPSKPALFISDTRIDSLVMRLQVNDTSTINAWKEIDLDAKAYSNKTFKAPQKWFVPLFYKNPTGHLDARSDLMLQANAAYTLALAYRITGNEQYAQACAAILQEWSSLKDLSKEEDSQLAFCYHFPPMVVAASLIEQSKFWDATKKAAFVYFLENHARQMTTQYYHNNWGNWGVLFDIVLSVYLNKANHFNFAANRLKELIAKQIDEEGVMLHEVTRENGKMGIWYSHFALQPTFIAAEILYENKVNIYSLEHGKKLCSAFAKAAKWTRSPEDFPYLKPPLKHSDLYNPRYYTLSYYGERRWSSISYFEIAKRHCSCEDAEYLLLQDRPMSSVFAFPFLTFTHRASYF